MGNFLDDRVKSSELDQKVFAREELIMSVTEELLIAMERQGISKIELARKLGKSKSFVTQILSGARNMTLKTLSDFCFVLGVEPTIAFDGIQAMSQSRSIDEPEKNWSRSTSVKTKSNVVNFATWNGRTVSVVASNQESSSSSVLIMVGGLGAHMNRAWQ